MVPRDLGSWVSQLDFSGVSSPHYPSLWDILDPLSFTVSKTRGPLLCQMVLKMPTPLPPSHCLLFPQLWACGLLKLEPSFPLQAEGKLGGCLLLTSSVDGTSLPVPGARRRLKLLALLSLPLYPPCFPGKPVGPIEGRQHQIQGLLPKGWAPHPHIPHPTQGDLFSQMQSISRRDLIFLFYALWEERSQRGRSPHLTDKKTESGVSRLHLGACSMAEPDWNQGSLTPFMGTNEESLVGIVGEPELLSPARAELAA